MKIWGVINWLNKFIGWFGIMLYVTVIAMSKLMGTTPPDLDSMAIAFLIVLFAAYHLKT